MPNFNIFFTQLEKDSMRTDRCIEFFNDANIHNVFTLERILKTFILLRPEIGILYIAIISSII